MSPSTMDRCVAMVTACDGIGKGTVSTRPDLITRCKVSGDYPAVEGRPTGWFAEPIVGVVTRHRRGGTRGSGGRPWWGRPSVDDLHDAEASYRLSSAAFTDRGERALASHRHRRAHQAQLRVASA